MAIKLYKLLSMFNEIPTLAIVFVVVDMLLAWSNATTFFQGIANVTASGTKFGYDYSKIEL